MSKILGNLHVVADTGATNALLVEDVNGVGLEIILDADGQVNLASTGSGTGGGNQRVSIGKSTVVDGVSSIGIGYIVSATGTTSTAIGGGGTQAHADFATAIGGSAKVSRVGGIAIGNSSDVNTTGGYGIAIGYLSEASNWDAIAIGRNTSATANGAMIMGHGVGTTTNSIGNSLALAWDGDTHFLFRDGGDSYLNGGQVAIGKTSATATLNIQGEGSTNATTAFLVENSSGNDLLDIDDAGNVVFNESSIDADFRIEGSTDTHLLFLSDDSITIGTGTVTPTAKVKIDTINDSSKTTMLYLISNVSTTGVYASTGGVGHTYALRGSATGSGGNNSYGVWGSAASSAQANNYGGYFNARNASTNSYGVYALSNAGTSTNTYGIFAQDSSTSANKHAGYFTTGGGVTGGTAYGLRSAVSASYHDNTLYGIHSRVSVNVAYTGQTAYAGYFETDLQGSAGSTEYGIVVPQTDNNSGFGTATPTTTLHVDGSFRYVDGNETAGYVLTSDSGGTATWQAAGGGGISTYAETLTTPSAGATNTITHNLGTTDITVQLWLASGDMTTARITNRSTNAVDVIFAAAPGENVDVVVQG